MDRYKIFNQTGEDQRLSNLKEEEKSSIPSSVKSKCSSKQVDGSKGIVYDIDEVSPQISVPQSIKSIRKDKKKDIIKNIGLTLDLAKINHLRRPDGDENLEESYRTMRNTSERNEKK